MVENFTFINLFLFSIIDLPKSKPLFNWNEEIILSLVIALSTVVYTYINWLVLKENKAIRKQKTTPLIIAFLEFSEIDETQIILKIKNIGEGLAKKISFNFNKDYNWVHESPLSERGALKYGISSFPPQYELNYILVINTTEVNFYDEVSYVEFNINYQNTKGKLFTNNYRLKFNEVTMQGYNKPPSTYKRAHIYQLKEINNCLKEIIKNHKAQNTNQTFEDFKDDQS